MAKKSWLIFALYFLFTSVGMVYGTHTCGKRVSKTVWGLSLSGKKACTCKHNSSKHKKNCCTSSATWLKAETDNGKLQTPEKFREQLPALPLLSSFDLYTSIAEGEKPAPVATAEPPPAPASPFYIRFRAILV